MLAVVDSKIPLSAAKTMEAEGFSILRLPPHPALPPSIASHPDMLLFFGKDKIYTTSIYAQIAEKEIVQILRTAKKELCILREEIHGNYPHDVLLNAFLLGKHLICHPDATADEIRELEGNHILSTRQGYAKCSAVPVGKHALITADPSIQRVACKNGIDVLMLKQHGVHLAGYDTGFIGGATGFAPYCEYPIIPFCGDFRLHPQGEEMEAFCRHYGYTCTSLAPIPLTDVGTIIILP